MDNNFKKWASSPVQQLKVFVDYNHSKLPLGTLNYHVKENISKFKWSQEALNLNQEWSPFKLKLSSKVCIPQDVPKDFNGLAGLFNDSLPDGWGIRLMDKTFSTFNVDSQYITPAFRLAFLGHRAFGALNYEPVADFSLKESIKIKFDELAQEMNTLIQGSVNDVSERILLAGGSPQGARPKVTLDISEDWTKAQTATDVPPEGYNSWLFKFASANEEKDSPIIEQIYMDLAKKMQIQTSPSKLIYSGNRWIFATKRFDRENGEKVFIHSLGGMLEKSHLEESHLDYGHIATILKKLKGGEKDLEEGFKRAVFNLVLSNRDDHVKNFSFMKKNNEWSLTPAYDLTYMEGFLGTHTLNFAGSKRKDPDYKDLMKLSEIYDLSKQRAREIIQHSISVAHEFRLLSKEYDLNKDLEFWISDRIEELSKIIKVPSVKIIKYK